MAVSAADPGANPTRYIYDRIYAAIMDQRLAPGAKLREAELCTVFGVSRTPVRQALIQLGQDGIVVLRHNRGAEVAQPTREEGHHIFVAREVIECAVARQLAQVHRAQDVRELRALARAERAAFAAGTDGEAITLAGTFHLRMAQMAGNPVLAALVARLVPQTSLLLALYRAPGTPLSGVHDHDRLADAIDAGEPGPAALAMRRYLQELERRLTPRPGRQARAVSEIFAGAALGRGGGRAGGR